MALETPIAVPKLPEAAAELPSTVPNPPPAEAKPPFAAALKAPKPPVLAENPFAWNEFVMCGGEVGEGEHKGLCSDNSTAGMADKCCCCCCVAQPGRPPDVGVGLLCERMLWSKRGSVFPLILCTFWTQSLSLTTACAHRASQPPHLVVCRHVGMFMTTGAVQKAQLPPLCQPETCSLVLADLCILPFREDAPPLLHIQDSRTLATYGRADSGLHRPWTPSVVQQHECAVSTMRHLHNPLSLQ